MNLILSIIITVLGLSIGSFLSVVIYRTYKKENTIFFSRSMCPNCRKKIKWRHLVPIFSWLFLRGKCAYCGKKISFHYLLLELFTGILFLGTYLKWNFLKTIPSITDPAFFSYEIDWMIFQKFIFLLVIFSLLTLIFFYDYKYKQIPDRFSIPTIGLAFLGGLIFKEPSITSMLFGGIGITTFFLLQFIISNGTWIGGGDLRLGAIMGLLLGWEHGLLALVLAYFFGAIVSVALLLSKKVTRKSAIPFGPFLITSTILVLFFGDFILDWYFSILIF